jgi:Fe-S oxidoreductase
LSSTRREAGAPAGSPGRPLRAEDFTAHTARCFRGEPASCTTACPFRLDIRNFLDKAARGKWTPAYKLLRNATVFPVIVAALCEAPCGERCQRVALGDEAIAVREIEAAVLRNVKEQKPERYVIPAKEQRVAVVGAGLAGLACALRLAQERYRVTVLERGEGWGGSLRADPRFPVFEADIARQFAAIDVEFRFGARVTALDEVAGFDAVYLATGAGGDSFGLLESWDCALYTTRDPRVFMGGALTGSSPVEAIAEGVGAAKVIQGYLQTGKVGRAPGDYQKESCTRYLTHEGVVRLPRVAPADAEGYSADEARAEAARCLQCDCDACMSGCEMLAHYRKEPQRLTIEAHADTALSPFASRTLTRETYSCNLCGHCAAVCPEDVDVGGLLRLSRAARVSAGVAPNALHDFWLREMDFATSEGAFSSAPAGKTTCAYAFYPGCQLGAGNPEHVLRTYELLAAQYDLGVIQSCCGAPAYWAGDDARMEADFAQTRRAWEELGRPTLVFACATCSMIFAAFRPEIPRVSVYELLAERAGAATGPAGRPPAREAAPPFAEAAIFDPCNARDDTGMENAVRELARVAGVTIRELPEKNRCCGHGGHIRVANPGLFEEIVRHRAEAGEQPYLVYCANCRDVFAWRGKECAHILDVALGLPVDPSVPTLEQKRANSLRAKKELMKRLRGVDFEPVRHEWDDLTLVIPAPVQRQMEEKLVSAAEVREAIWVAETGGDFFYAAGGAGDAGDGGGATVGAAGADSAGVGAGGSAGADTRLASLVKPVFTYWVEYRATAPRTYEVLAAYCHRMRIEREK